jgi:hypothetical protein
MYTVFIIAELGRELGVFPKDIELDTLWDESSKLHLKFEYSPYDNPNKGLYECVTEFLQSVKETDTFKNQNPLGS